MSEIKSSLQIAADYAGYASMGVLATHRGLQLGEDIYRFATKVPKLAPYKIGNFSKKTTMALSVLSMPMIVFHAATAIEHIQSGEYTCDDIYALSGAIFLGVNLATAFFNPKSRLVAGVKLATFIGGAAIDVAGLITAKTKEDFLTQLVMVVLFNSERGGPARNLAKGAYDLVASQRSPVASRGEGTSPVQPATIAKLAAGLLAGVLYAAYPSPAHAADDHVPRTPVPHQGDSPRALGQGGVPRDVILAELTAGRRRRVKDITGIRDNREAIKTGIQKKLFETGEEIRTEELGSYFDLSAESVDLFLRKVHENLIRLGKEEPADSAEVVCTFLEGYRGQQEDFNFMIHFIWNDYLIPIRKLYGLRKNLNDCAASARNYQTWKLPTPHEAQVIKEPLVRERIGFSAYFVEIWPGLYYGVSRGGLEFRLALEDGAKLMKVGVICGDGDIKITDIQGTYLSTKYRPELLDLLADDPFNWLINGVSEWAAMYGYQRLVGYGYRYNAWLDHELIRGLLPQNRMNHLEKLYELRFQNGLSMEASPIYENVYHRELNEPLIIPLIYEAFLRCMNRFLRDGLSFIRNNDIVPLVNVEDDPFFTRYNDNFGSD